MTLLDFLGLRALNLLHLRRRRDARRIHGPAFAGVRLEDELLLSYGAHVLRQYADLTPEVSVFQELIVERFEMREVRVSAGTALLQGIVRAACGWPCTRRSRSLMSLSASVSLPRLRLRGSVFF